MVLRNRGASYVLPDLGYNLLLTTHIVSKNLSHDILLNTYVILTDIGQDLPLTTYAIISDISHKIPFSIGCVQHIDLSAHMMAHYVDNSI